MPESLSLPVDQKLEQWREETRPRLPFTAEAYLAGTPIPEFVPPDPEKLDAILSYFGLQQDSFGCASIPEGYDIRTRLRLRSFNAFEAKLMSVTNRNLIYALASRPAMSGPYIHGNFFYNYRPFRPGLTCRCTCGNKRCVNPFHMELVEEDTASGFWVREGFPLFNRDLKPKMYERSIKPTHLLPPGKYHRNRNKLFPFPFLPVIKAVDAVGPDPVLRVKALGTELLRLIGPGGVFPRPLWEPDHLLDYKEGDPIHLWKWRIRGLRVATFFSTSVRYRGAQLPPATAFWRLCFGSSPTGHRVFFGGQGVEYRNLRDINERYASSDNKNRKSRSNSTHNFAHNYIDLNPFSYSLVGDQKVEYEKDEYGNRQKEDKFISPMHYQSYCARRGFIAPWPNLRLEEGNSGLIVPDAGTGATFPPKRVAARNPAYPDDWLRV